MTWTGTSKAIPVGEYWSGATYNSVKNKVRKSGVRMAIVDLYGQLLDGPVHLKDYHWPVEVHNLQEDDKGISWIFVDGKNKDTLTLNRLKCKPEPN